MKELIRELTSCYGVSGDEGKITALLKDRLSEYGRVYTDAMNNVKCAIPGTGPKILLNAHIDQIGFIVLGIDDDGFIKVAKSGGIDRRALLSRTVTIWGKHPLTGVISCQPPHLLNHDAYKKAPDISDISIDVGLTKEEVQTLVSPGDRATLQYQYHELLGSRISASYMDDRSGVASILRCLELIKKSGAKPNLLIAFSAQEEVGTRGGRVLAFDEAVDEAIAVDVSFAMTPDSDAYRCGELGKGPMIGVSPVLCRDIYSALQKIADEAQIPFQLEVMGGETGTDADVISVTGAGIKMGLLSIPLRYMHTPVETADINDIENTAELLSRYVIGKAGEKV